jgi:molybdopterin converting factor small subunit
MPRQTPEQYAAFQELCRQNGLDPRADVWQHKQSGQWIIARTGIEKIQGHNNIGVDLELAAAAVDFAVVKATATRTVKAEGTKVAKKLSIQSLGSAQAKNSQVTYYAEMAEKRAKSRAILMLMGFYALGIYGEDEADDFKRPAEPAQPTGNGAGGSATSSEPPVMRAESNSAAPVASTGADQNASQLAGPAIIPAEVLAKFTQQFEACKSGMDVKNLWGKLTRNEATALFDVKEAAKARVALAAQQAAAAAARTNGLKDAGDNTTLVAEFIEQPALVGVAFTPATDEQRAKIQQLLNHPLITRKEKTYLLIGINKLDTERARQAIIKLRGAIEDRENGDTVSKLREHLHQQLNQYGRLLGEEIVAEYALLVENANASLDQLRAALSEVRDVLSANQEEPEADEAPEAETAIAA